MSRRYLIALVVLVVALAFSSIYANDNIQTQTVADEFQQHLKEMPYRQLKRESDKESDMGVEERKLGLAKITTLFKKKPDPSKAKTLLRSNAHISKIEIPAGKTVDITKLKSVSGKRIDLTKKFSSQKTFPRAQSQSDLVKIKRFTEKDPDLRSISSVVGKNPTKFSANQVRGVTSFVQKHPRAAMWMFNILQGTLFLLALAALVGAFFFMVG
ncbi:RxLR effector protein [Phytophthora megakarya]|uniref:RxLR effector protein n=1 Tax=Phytophthora megakarya TaxID=4795 RepID=A0A225VUP7_9STRA|nr:RxLR effector protein [Phytophthora megakarya]